MPRFKYGEPSQTQIDATGFSRKTLRCITQFLGDCAVIDFLISFMVNY